MATSRPDPTDPTEPDHSGDTRSVANRPVDPNSITRKVKVPPGVHPDEVWDPGNQTPGAPPVDNRS